MRLVIAICILLGAFQSDLMAKGGKKALEDKATTKTAPAKTSTIFSQTIANALPDLEKGDYLAGYQRLSDLKGPFDTSKMSRDELIDYGNYIYALVMCEVVLLPSNNTEEHKKRLASQMLTAAEALEQVGDPKFFIVKCFLQEQTFKEWLMRKLLYPTQLQDDFSKYLDNPQKERLKALIERVKRKEEEKRLKAKL